MSHQYYNFERTVWTEGRPLSELLVTFSEIYSDVVFLFSDYLPSFCVANGKDCPQPKQINEIFMQQVSYSRQKLQREKGRCAQYDQEREIFHVHKQVPLVTQICSFSFDDISVSLRDLCGLLIISLRLT